MNNRGRGAVMKAICVGAVLALMSIFRVAQADTTPGPTADSSSLETAPYELTEVTVTAQRREELSRDVPISLTVVNNQDLEKSAIVNVTQLNTIVPSFMVDRAGVYAQEAIRGVTTSNVQPGNESAIATYIDGVYLQGQSAGIFDLPDVERIEVLEGPQGTLTGRNSTGGAIFVHTPDPSYETQGKVAVGIGNFDDEAAIAFISGPIIMDKVAASLSVHYDKMSGYSTDIVSGLPVGAIESEIIRGKLRVDPMDGLRIDFAGSVSMRDDSSSGVFVALDGNTVGRGY